jgi:tetratricopeptide (TPR) repeat protein
LQAALDWSYDLLSEGAKLLFIAATLGQAVGDFESAWPMNEESRKVFENAGYKKGAADAHGTGGLIALGLGRPEEALDLMQEAVRLNLGVNNEWVPLPYWAFRPPCCSLAVISTAPGVSRSEG